MNDNQHTPPGNTPPGTIILWYILIFIGLTLLLQHLANPSAEQLSYSTFKTLLRQGHIHEVQIGSRTIRGTRSVLPEEALKKPTDTAEAGSLVRFVTLRVEDPDLVRDLEAHQVPYRGQHDNGLLDTFLAWLLPVGFLFLFWTLLARRMGPGQGLMQFGKSRARLYMEKQTGVTFADVAGVDEAKEELQEVIDFLRHAQKYVALGGRIPKGVLLVGPPGTGKTLLARAVAGEATVPFFSLSGSDFVEMFVGVGAARVRDLFQQAQDLAPAIVFIDELDAVGKARGMSPLQQNDEREQTLNQLLAEMDGFDPRKGVVILAATNRPEILDPALLRADLLVLGLPRGGVPVAYEIAQALKAPLDLMLVRKLGLPGHAELAMGAIAMGGIRVLNAKVVERLGVPAAVIDTVAAAELRELQRRERLYRGDRPVPDFDGQCVILVDDGLATGATMRAAIAAVRQHTPAQVLVAVPVAPAATVRSLRQEADDVICPATPEPFFGIGQWYEDFTQVTDEEVCQLLERAWQRPPARRMRHVTAP